MTIHTHYCLLLTSWCQALLDKADVEHAHAEELMQHLTEAETQMKDLSRALKEKQKELDHMAADSEKNLKVKDALHCDHTAAKTGASQYADMMKYPDGLVCWQQ